MVTFTDMIELKIKSAAADMFITSNTAKFQLWEYPFALL